MRELLYYSLIALSLFYVIYKVSEEKYARKYRLVYIFEAFVVITTLTFVDFAKYLDVNVFDVQNVNRLIYTVLTIAIVLTAAKYIYKIKFRHLFLIGISYFISLELSFKIAHNFYLDLINYYYILSSVANIIVEIITNLINFMIWFIVIKVIKERQYYQSLISFLPLLICVFTIFIILVLMNIKVSSLSYLSLVIIIILMNYSMIYIYMKNMRKLNIELNEKKFEIERNYYKEKLELEMHNYNRSFGFVHDSIYKLKDIKAALTNNDLDKLNKEVDDLHNDLIKEFNVLYTSSKTVSLVLNNHLFEIANNDIKVKTTIKYADFTFMDEVDAISLFDKLLVYAIKVNESSNNNYKFINISTENKNSSIIIKIIFSKDDEEFNDILIDDIKEIVKRYKGRYLEEYEDIDAYATINISFNLTDINEYFAIENQKS